MRCLKINGPRKISGEVQLSGNKNAALPMIAAAMLTEEQVILHNVPDIIDVRNMAHIAEYLGASVSYDSGTMVICAKDLNKTCVSKELCNTIRTSFLFAGPLTARCASAEVFAPGGDVIGRRRLDGHFYGLKKLGVELELDYDQFKFRRNSALQGTEMFLDEAGVTSTEHLMMTAVLARGTTIIRNAACEPHVTQLAMLLNAMGAKISGLETNLLIIEGVEKLHGAEVTLFGDHIEAASFLSLCAACGGSIDITGEIVPHHYWMMRRILERFGVNILLTPNHISMSRNSDMLVVPDFGNKIPVISDGPWPQFPSDMMSCMIAVATQAAGTTLFFEKMFESRIYFVDKLISMGANAVVCDPHRVLISGPSQLHGSEMPSPDIRAGMALIIAASCAQGESLLKNADMVYRGYCNLPEKLRSLGCDIREVER